MCLDFTSLDISELQRNISGLITPSAKTAGKSDPIWGQQQKSVLPFTVGVKNHGTLIEKTVIKLVRSSTQWDGVRSYKIKISGEEKEFDNIVYNKSLKVIIVLECKRDVNQVSGPYTRNIKEYIKILPSEAKRIGFYMFAGLKDYKVYFAIFNAYGAHKSMFCNKPVIEPKHLNEIFSECVSLGWQAFEKEKYNFFKGNEISTNKSFETRVKNYLNFEQLEEYFSTSKCELDCNQNSDQKQIQLQAIERILGKPMLIL